MLNEIYKYHILAVGFLKGLMEKFIEAFSYAEMKKSKEIKILAGEYMDEAQIIYTPKLE